MEHITQNIKEIKKPANWRVLNKGTHYEDDQPEFERTAVKNVIIILKALDDDVRDLRIQELAVGSSH